MPGTTGWASLPDAENSRNVILPEPEVRALIDAAWETDSELGLFVETAAVTGARPSQLARLNVGDLSGSKSAPALNMPTSKKGPRAKAHLTLSGADSISDSGQAPEQSVGR